MVSFVVVSSLVLSSLMIMVSSLMTSYLLTMVSSMMTMLSSGLDDESVIPDHQCLIIMVSSLMTMASSLMAMVSSLMIFPSPCLNSIRFKQNFSPQPLVHFAILPSLANVNRIEHLFMNLCPLSNSVQIFSLCLCRCLIIIFVKPPSKKRKEKSLRSNCRGLIPFSSIHICSRPNGQFLEHDFVSDPGVIFILCSVAMEI